MEIHKVNYITESYIITGINRGLTETDVMRFYSDLGYNVLKKYVNYIKGLDPGKRVYSIMKDLKISNDIVKLFMEFNSGYPDIVLIKDGKLSFVEIKLDGDSIRSNQIVFLDRLSNFADVKVCYFNNLELFKKEEYTRISKYTPEQKVILNQIELLHKISKVRNNKPFWIVAELYKKFDFKILDKKILGLIANKISQPKDRVVWFINTSLKKPGKKDYKIK